MTRKEFVRVAAMLGLSLPFQFSFNSCTKEENLASNFKGKVIIIGAGAGGLSAGYLLQQRNIDFEILEASSRYGGRMRIDTDFADFPIPLGAEWIETDTGIFQRIVNDASVEPNLETVRDESDRKFVNYSWFHFFEEYLVPSISEKIVYNSVVQSIDYSGEQISLTTQNGSFLADKVIVSVPLKILQLGDLNFSPPLPQAKQNAIQLTTIWEGFKAFIEFSENFYDEGHLFTITPESDGQKLYYDATLGQNTSRNILGLFVVGKPALDYIALSDEALKDFILKELDALFSNQASANYVKHLSQNWNDEPFIKAGYMTDDADPDTVKILSESVVDKIYFAGGAYTDGEDWVSVHTAAESGKKAVEEILFD